MNAVTVILCAAPEAQARGMADRLLEERLAACVQLLGPVTSRYRWRGEVEEAREVLLLIKTAGRVASRARARLRELHPYEVPEILELHADSGLPEYLAWVTASCQP